MTAFFSTAGTSSHLPAPFTAATADSAVRCALPGICTMWSGTPGVAPGKTGQCWGQASLLVATAGQQLPACPGRQRGQGSLGNVSRSLAQFSQKPSLTASTNSFQPKVSGQDMAGL